MTLVVHAAILQEQGVNIHTYMYIDCCRCKLRSVLEVMGTSAFSIVSIYVINKKVYVGMASRSLVRTHPPPHHPPTHPQKKKKKRERFVYYDLLY